MIMSNVLGVDKEAHEILVQIKEIMANARANVAKAVNKSLSKLLTK